MKLKQLTLISMAFLLPLIGLSKSKSSTVSLNEDVTLEAEDGMAFSLVGDLDDLPFPYEVLSEYSPDGVEVTWTGKKFKTPKAGHVKYSKKDEDFVDTKESENPCALKLSVSKKTGKVSGSFKVYTAKSEKKLKTYTAKVSGYVGAESLTVTIKKIGSITASLE